MTDHAPADQPVGYDTVQVEAWIAQHIPILTLPLRWTRLEGGHSNLTYLIEDCLLYTSPSPRD